MEFFVLFSILITIAAIFSYINIRTFRLPSGISLMLMGTLVSSAVLLGTGISPDFADFAKENLSELDFSEFILGILLSFLLFAGSLHVQLSELKSQSKSILSFATLSTLISTGVIGIAVFYLLEVFGVHAPLIYCLLFGALISPTDPVAVLSILKTSSLSSSIQTRITGESLFNDGVGVVIFATFAQIEALGIEKVSAGSVAVFFAQEALGGILLGALIGFVGFRLMKSIDHFQTEILISLAMVMGGYTLCHALHVSGPLAMVVSGLVTGNMGRQRAMSDHTRDYLEKFWEVVDEILNAILFMLIGLELMVVSFQVEYLWVGLIVALMLVVVRYFSLWLPDRLFRLKSNTEGGALQIMTWGGLRGGISIALALSLPHSEVKNILVSITFVVVLFSVLVQGFTLGKVIQRFSPSVPVAKSKRGH